MTALIDPLSPEAWKNRRRAVFWISVVLALKSIVGTAGLVLEPSWPLAATTITSTVGMCVTLWLYMANVHKASELGRVAREVAEGVQAARAGG
jgi:hypothetical protein